MRENDYSFFQNRGCCYFPCHEGADPETFNCLFCYCPLYALGDKCGGNCTFTVTDIKDCSNCLIPHSENGYAHIIENFPRISELEKQIRNQGNK